MDTGVMTAVRTPRLHVVTGVMIAVGTPRLHVTAVRTPRLHVDTGVMTAVRTPRLHVDTGVITAVRTQSTPHNTETYRHIPCFDKTSDHRQIGDANWRQCRSAAKQISQISALD